MRIFTILIVLVLALGCSGRATPKTTPAANAGPEVVRVTLEEFERELERLEHLQSFDNRPVEKAISETIAKFGVDQVHVLTAGTDSLSEGVDGWRTCAKLANNQIFGVPEDFMMVFYTVNNELCEGHPSDIVGRVVAIFPGDRVDPHQLPFVSPSYKNEQLTLGRSQRTMTHFDH